MSVALTKTWMGGWSHYSSFSKDKHHWYISADTDTQQPSLHLFTNNGSYVMQNRGGEELPAAAKAVTK
jgi:hypothetical protein